MYLNQFSVRIIGGDEKESGYVEVSHGKVYSLQLRNDHNVRCDARVEIDGKEIGTFRINANSSLSLERPVNSDGKFTFYKEGTYEALKSEIFSGNANNGLISVTFTPERKTFRNKPFATYSYSDHWSIAALAEIEDTQVHSLNASYNASYRGAGGTGLSGKSNQNFVDAREIQYDLSGRTTINLRLVAKEENQEPRPLVGLSNPVPPYRR